MKRIYTVGTRLYAKNGDKTELLDTYTMQFAYRSRENASKEVEALKKANIQTSDYEATEDPTTLQKRGQYSDTIFILKFVITEHVLSDYEQES